MLKNFTQKPIFLSFFLDFCQNFDHIIWKWSSKSKLKKFSSRIWIYYSSYVCHLLLISPIVLKLKKIKRNVHLNGYDNVTKFQGSMLNRSQDTRGAQCRALTLFSYLGPTGLTKENMIFLYFSADTIPSFPLFTMSKADIRDGQIIYSIYPSDYLLNKLRVAIFAKQATERDSSRTINKMKWQHKRGPQNTNSKKIVKILESFVKNHSIYPSWNWEIYNFQSQAKRILTIIWEFKCNFNLQNNLLTPKSKKDSQTKAKRRTKTSSLNQKIKNLPFVIIIVT